MSFYDLQDALDNKTLTIDLAQKYLKLYIADIDWQPHIASLWGNAQKKFKEEGQAKDYVKRAVSCAILLPSIDGSTIPDPASNLLFWCTGWKQFSQNDWFELFLDVLKEDIRIIQNRNSIIQLGIIDPIDVPPMTRQAFNWLYEKALEKESLSEQQIHSLREKLANLVRVYGGATICNIFINHKLNVDKVFNWRSGYFFEKQIHKVYSLDQIRTLKKAEIAKTNSNYIKKMEQKVGA